MYDAKISRRGVYYDVKQSPYVYKTPYGDTFKFSSRKKLEIYTRDVPKEIKRVTNLFDRNSIYIYLSSDVKIAVKKAVYLAFYKKVEY